MDTIRSLFIVCVFIFVNSAAIADYYVLQGASGNNSGSDWANARTTFPTSTQITRAVGTIWIGDGNYGSINLDEPHSGSTIINIKKATQSSHGTDTGWFSTYGDGQAVFTEVDFYTGYWVFDGITGGGPGSWETGFGFSVGLFWTPTSDVGITDIEIRHVEVDVGATAAEDSNAVDMRYFDSLTISYCFLHDVGADVFKINHFTNFIIEYSKIARNYQDATWHGDVFEIVGGPADNLIVRYCFFEDVEGSYCFGTHGPDILSYQIYGNILTWPNKDPAFGNGLVSALSGDGSISGLRFFNNSLNFGDGFGTLLIGTMGGGSDNILRNNIIRRTGTGGSVSDGGLTQSGNTAYGVTISGWENLSGNPFTNVASGDFSLIASSTNGVTLSTPYDTDMFGSVRGNDGNWDRGALEFNEGIPNPVFNITTLTVQ